MSKINKMFEIIKFIKKYKIENYIINDDFTIDVKGNVTIYEFYKKELKSIPIQFGNVSGNFSCSSLFLTTLEGCPRKVGGLFDCGWCQDLTSLEGAPEYVGGDFNCSSCLTLTSLEGGPKYVGGKYMCSFSPSLTSLKGAPKYVGKGFSCINSPSLTSLQGAPEYVGGDFNCYATKITSLKGIGEVKGEIYSDFFEGYLKDYKGEL